ncbi:cytochrome P450, partial [Mycena pura]
KKNVLTEEELVAQTGILMIAGQDTVTDTLVFGCLELARHPEFQHKLRAEFHSSLRSPYSTSAYESMLLLNAFICQGISFERMKGCQCELAHWCHQEALRLYPPEAIQDLVTVKDTVIPLTDGINNAKGELTNRIPV